MIEQESLAIARFTAGLNRSYPPIFPYFVLADGPEAVARSSRDFRNSRQELMELLLMGRAIQEELSLSFALEHMVNLALRVPFEETGFTVQLSPQTLERSEPGQKGVDLLICDSENLIYLGIDVKLRAGHSSYQRDGYGWNPGVLSPYIYLALGNFVVNMREQQNISVREWLKRYAIPKIGSTGKIPQLDLFRSYLIGRIERSISGSLERLRDPYNNDERPIGFPRTAQELTIMEEKLSIMQSLFFDLRQV